MLAYQPIDLYKLFYIVSQSSLEINNISFFFEGKLYRIHHLRTELSDTLNFFPICVKGILRIKLFNSSLVGLPI